MDYKSTLMWKEINETPDVFTLSAKNNADVIKAIAAEVRKNNIKNIYAVARGTSDHALIFFKYAVEIGTGIPVTLGACSAVTLYDGALDLSGNLVIGCSQSGRAADVLEILKRGNKQGAVTLAITNNPESPVAKEAKYHIFCSAGEEKSVAATKTFSAQLFALLSLAAELADCDKGRQGLKGIANTLKNNMSALDNATDAAAKKYYEMESGFVLSRGITYAIAPEAALKLQETSYIRMKGYPTSDFYHGPMAMIDKGTPVIFFCARYGFGEGELAKNHFEDQVKGIDQMLSLGADVLVVTDDISLDKKYAGKADTALIPESINEYFSIFNFAVFAQMLACKISCARGNNPDSPRALNKVTVTK